MSGPVCKASFRCSCGLAEGLGGFSFVGTSSVAWEVITHGPLVAGVSCAVGKKGWLPSYTSMHLVLVAAY